MTSNRYWAPAGPHLGPDDVELAMLTPTGGDSRLDLGAILIAAHRVGEAACQEAARQPICDAGTLAVAISKARDALTDTMITSVSKCVSEGEHYAGLLVRDVLDDAEQTTVELFGAAVARGVARPLAAQRAGAVFGVPSQELAKYRTLALDPKTNPVALTAAADEVLFRHISALTEQETTVEVSKAPVATRERIATTPTGQRYYNVRDEHGEFAASPAATAPTLRQPGLLARVRSRYGITGGLVPTVSDGRPSAELADDTPHQPPTAPARVAEQAPTQAGAPAAAATKPKLTPEQFRARQKALRRTRRTTQQAESPQRAEREQATRSRASRKRTQRAKALQAQAILSPKMERTIEAADQAQAERLVDPKDLKPTFQQANHPLLDTFPRTGKHYRELDYPVGYVLPTGQAFPFNGAVASSPQRLVRIGHLETLAGGQAEDVHDVSHEGNVQNTGWAADGEEPIHRVVPANQIPPGEAGIRLLEGMRSDFAHEQGDYSADYTAVLPSSDDDGSMVIFTEVADDDTPPPTVFEYIVENGVGRVEGTGGNWHYDLDPNQAYMMSSPTEWERTYDPHNGLIRTRIRLYPVDEDRVTRARRGEIFEKAVAVQLRPTTDLGTTPTGQHYYDRRDEHGQFTRGGLLARVAVPPSNAADAVTAPAKPALTPAQFRARKKALARNRTRARQEAPAQQATRQRATRQQLTRPLNERGRAQQKIIQRVSSEFYDTRDPVPQLPLDPGLHYRVLDEDDLADIRYDNAGVSDHGDGVIRVRKSDSLLHLHSGWKKGDSVRPRLRESYYDLMQAVTGQETEIHGPYNTSTLPGTLLLSQHAYEVANSGEYGMVTVVPDDEDFDSTSLHTSSAPESLVLVEFDESAMPGDDVDLIPAGEYWHRDVTSSLDNHTWTGGLTTHMNMRVRKYIAVNPTATPDVLRAMKRGER